MRLPASTRSISSSIFMSPHSRMLPAGEDGIVLRLDLPRIGIALALCAGTLIWRRGLKRPFSPILLILFSAACGIVAYGF